MLLLKSFVIGFFIKSAASFDDTVTKIPVITSITRTREGKIAFAVGNLGAVALVVVIASAISALLSDFGLLRYILAGLIFLLALNALRPARRHKYKNKPKHPSGLKLLSLIGIGFVVAFVSLIDDAVLFIPLFANEAVSYPLAVAGIFGSTLLDLIIVILFAEKLERIKYSHVISFLILTAIAILILTGIL